MQAKKTDGRRVNRGPSGARLKARAAALRSLFPHEVLTQALERRGLNAFQAARQAGVSLHAVLTAMRGEGVPQARTLKKLLDGLGIDRTPFAAVLAAQEPVIVVCPHCGRARTLNRSHLKSVGRMAKGRHELRKREDGIYERPCRPCSAREKGRATLERHNERMLKKRLGNAAASVFIEEAKAGDETSRKKLRMAIASFTGGAAQRAKTIAQFRNYVRKPKPEKHRHAIGLSNVVTRAMEGRITKPFFLCPLCELVTHAQQWHRPCWYAWMSWYQRTVGHFPKVGARPPALRPRTRGPKPETNLARNYGWLIAIRGAGKSLRAVVKDHGREISAKSSVTEAVQAFLHLLPGSWDLVFSESPLVRRANIHRHKLVPLPLEMERVVGIGGRDPLIRRLLEFGMAEGDVARLTGMGLPRVKGIRLALTSPLAASA